MTSIYRSEEEEYRELDYMLHSGEPLMISPRGFWEMKRRFRELQDKRRGCRCGGCGSQGIYDSNLTRDDLYGSLA